MRKFDFSAIKLIKLVFTTPATRLTESYYMVTDYCPACEAQVGLHNGENVNYCPLECHQTKEKLVRNLENLKVKIDMFKNFAESGEVIKL